MEKLERIPFRYELLVEVDDDIVVLVSGALVRKDLELGPRRPAHELHDPLPLAFLHAKHKYRSVLGIEGAPVTQLVAPANGSPVRVPRDGAFQPGRDVGLLGKIDVIAHPRPPSVAVGG